MSFTNAAIVAAVAFGAPLLLGFLRRSVREQPSPAREAPLPPPRSA